MSVLESLEPKLVWKYFDKICAIPHPSKHEHAIVAWVKSVADELGLPWREDQAGGDVGNVVVTKPATPGHEDAPILVLQGHLDMVGVARPDVEHDFLTDPIRPVIKDGWVHADGTTLGADNGIGAALMLAIMEDQELVHGPLEFFFTIDEEAGMTGAHEVVTEFVKGRRLINLDTEEWGEIYISCAGGGDSIVTLPVQRGPADPGAQTFKIHVGGLLGGHSGADIHLGRGVGTKILIRLVAGLGQRFPIRLRSIEGGTKRNSIPDWGTAVLDVPADRADQMKDLARVLGQELHAEIAKVDPGMQVTVEPVESELAPMNREITTRLLDLLVALPQGILAMSPEVDGLVETSSNLGTMRTTAEHVQTVNLTRSAVTSFLVHQKDRIRAVAESFGAQIEEPRGYPGWKPNMDSELLRISQQTFQAMSGKEAAIKAIHAGLECGLFSEKFPGIDMISIGPDMRDVHSPDERLHIETTGLMYDYMRQLLTALA